MSMEVSLFWIPQTRASLNQGSLEDFAFDHVDECVQGGVCFDDLAEAQNRLNWPLTVVQSDYLNDLIYSA